jgi:hypothetical protein
VPDHHSVNEGVEVGLPFLGREGGIAEGEVGTGGFLFAGTVRLEGVRSEGEIEGILLEEGVFPRCEACGPGKTAGTVGL